MAITKSGDNCFRANDLFLPYKGNWVVIDINQNFWTKLKSCFIEKEIEMSNYLRSNPHNILTRLIAANIVFDGVAIAFWGAFPATQWSIYRLGFSIVGTEAALAATLFALTLFGLIKRKKWAPFLAIAIPITQRAFATYVFFPNPADIQIQPLILLPNAATLIWSLIIIYFALKDIKTRNKHT